MSIPIGVVTVSDRASAGVYEDKGGPGIEAALSAILATPWRPVRRVIPDDRARIEATLIELAEVEGCSLILTTGGTGPAARDVTPEATEAVCERMMPGFGELMRTRSLLEVPTAILSERYGLGRKPAALVTIAAIAALGVPASLSQSTMAEVKIFGFTPFDLFDFASSNVLLPLGGILICLFVGWVYGPEKAEKSLSNHGALANRGLIKAAFFLIRYVAPLAIAIVLLNGLKVF